MANINSLIRKYSKSSRQVRDEVAKYLYKRHKDSEDNKMKKTAKETLVGGKADGQPDSKYDKKQIAMGMKVEEEHVGKDEPEAAKEIAKDHLEEDPKYYSKLKKLEEGFKKKASMGAHAAELAGLGILAAPSIAEMRGKKVSDKKKHIAELAGLGTLAVPSLHEAGKVIYNKAKPYISKAITKFRR